MATRVRTVDVFGPADILEYAIGLIEEFGWRQGDRPTGSDLAGLKTAGGYSLHDSVGYATERLFSIAGIREETAPARRADKEGRYQTPSGMSASLREETSDLVQAQLPQGMNDIEFNDKAQTADEVLDVLRKAHQEALNA